jgi:hypothetical protein
LIDLRVFWHGRGIIAIPISSDAMTGLQRNQDVVTCLKQGFSQWLKLVGPSGKPVEEKANFLGGMGLEKEFRATFFVPQG